MSDETPKPNETIEKTTTSEENQDTTISRRGFLKGAAAMSALVLGGEFLATTEREFAPKEEHLNLELLENKKRIVTAVEVTNAAIFLAKSAQEQLHNREISDIVSEVMNSFDVLRNYMATNPKSTEKIVGLLHDFNLGEEIVFDHNNPKSNFVAIRQLESYFVLRHLRDLEVITEDDAMLDKFKFAGTATYSGDYIIRLGGNYDYDQHLESPFNVAGAIVTKEQDSLETTDRLIQKNSRHIMDASKKYNIDPSFIAAIISMEARDLKTFRLYTNNPGSTLPEEYLSNYLFFEHPETSNNTEGVLGVVNRTLRYIKSHPNEASDLGIPENITEDVLDFAAAWVGKNSSIGVGQINIDTAKRFEVVNMLGRRFKNTTPSALVGTLLANNRLNIMSIGALSRKMVDEYERIQDKELNFYVPNLKEYSISSDKMSPLEDDPLFGHQFAAAFYGGAWTTLFYPEYQNVKEKNRDWRLRVPFQMRNHGRSDWWGSAVASYTRYYQQTKNKERLGLQ